MSETVSPALVLILLPVTRLAMLKAAWTDQSEMWTIPQRSCENSFPEITFEVSF